MYTTLCNFIDSFMVPDLIIMPSRKKSYSLLGGFIALPLLCVFFVFLYGATMLDGDNSFAVFASILFFIAIPSSFFYFKSYIPQHTFSFYSDHIDVTASRIYDKNALEPRPLRLTVPGLANFLVDISAKARFTKHAPIDYHLAMKEQSKLTVFYKDIRNVTFKVAGFSELVKTKHMFVETDNGPLMLQHIDYADVQKIADFLKSKGVSVQVL